jgi:hypothetical protein
MFVLFLAFQLQVSNHYFQIYYRFKQNSTQFGENDNIINTL